MPGLVHDGGPRIDAVSLALEDLAHGSSWAEKGVTVSIRYSARYWVADQEAAAFAGRFLDMTAEEFLATGDAKEQPRGGTGKNIHTSEGTVTAHAVPQPDGKMLLNTVSGVFNFGSSDFTG
jgi:hypothetical protein